jgi:hypothetical protein
MERDGASSIVSERLASGAAHSCDIDGTNFVTAARRIAFAP